MRLNKFISSTGLCSRRKADELIAQGKVIVNKEIATLGLTVEEHDVVEVEGKILARKTDADVYIALNKPPGITCTTEEHIDGNIVDFINHEQRIFPIGRLDKESEGLILLTSDGDIVNEILREENNHEKDYIVMVNKEITASFIEGMSNGVEIYNPVKNEYTITNKCKVIKLSDRSFKITLSQGLNRQIRRMCSQFDYQIYKLQRVRVAHITLRGLELGQWRNLTDDEVRKFKSNGHN
ncbi:pseudouridine synthase [Lederbergia lenta]|uniref:Pseudouridine synthase n=1 Tax=Lederbergia lenta TaxID=1467 RepID=A0A2X4WUX5_LEDLE|nr:pseudouridine synthase [Lederbergia lenta]MCM3112270.1 pseudouridine synthase [Lederbergia lenta]MEC2323437.1 pseudouridine synthase [Lederbergia lenta]SQI63408.1 pseudouridine synthase F [Lederbergia lenta]